MSNGKTRIAAGENTGDEKGLNRITSRTHSGWEDLAYPNVTVSEDPNAKVDEYLAESQAGYIPEHITSPADISRLSSRTETAPSATDLEKGAVDVKLVTFFIDDPENPKNWSKGFKWYCTMVVALLCFAVAFSSAVVTGDLAGPAEEFHVSTEVAILTVSLFVMGFGIGPMVFAPMSELFGRKVVYIITFGISIIFIIPCAVAKNIGTLLVCRAIDGIAFSAPMTLVGGTLADMWKNEERGTAMAAFSAAPFLGPALGPIVGGFVGETVGWRWIYWVMLIFCGVCYILMVFTIPETFAPTILRHRAARLRKEKNDPTYLTEQELHPRPLREMMKISLLRPFQLLCQELIVMLISLYMSVIYGLLYMFFFAYPVVFQEGKGFSDGITGLMFIPIAVGVVVGALAGPLVNRHYLYLHKKHGGHPPPETRLIPMMVACWCIPIGLFIFAWTSYPTISWVGPCLAGFPVGLGCIVLYNAANNYLVDSYQHFAASALAAKTFVRSFYGAGCCLFIIQMYHRLGKGLFPGLRLHGKQGYRTDMHFHREPVGRHSAGVHRTRVLCHSLHFLLQGRSNQEELQVCIRGRRLEGC
ncbi:hypothetical protein AcW1_003935 [Taiwanofungus camphoratus]|nr:hypothetical protein AcW1_003935 [Antrodia cinnamomea]